MDGEWHYLDKQDSRVLLDRVQAGIPSSLVPTAQKVRAFRCLELSFYSGGLLCEGLVPGVSSETGILTFIAFPDGGITTLDGTSDPIHALNQSAPIVLDTSSRASEYVRFFNAAIYAQNGNFRIVNDAGDVSWARDASAGDKELAAKYIRPFVVTNAADGGWKASATVQYGTSIHSVIFEISPSGEVVMLEDVPLVANLPLRRDTFRGPLRFEVPLYK